MLWKAVSDGLVGEAEILSARILEWNGMAVADAEVSEAQRARDAARRVQTRHTQCIGIAARSNAGGLGGRLVAALSALAGDYMHCPTRGRFQRSFQLVVGHGCHWLFVCAGITVWVNIRR